MGTAFLLSFVLVRQHQTKQCSKARAGQEEASLARLLCCFRKCRVCPFWLPGRGTVQHPQRPGGRVIGFLAVVVSHSVKNYLFLTMLFLIHANRIQMYKNKKNTTQKY
jgi:hypothetical protein